LSTEVNNDGLIHLFPFAKRSFKPDRALKTIGYDDESHGLLFKYLLVSFHPLSLHRYFR